jgi:hypothetical protein
VSEPDSSLRPPTLTPCGRDALERVEQRGFTSTQVRGHVAGPHISKGWDEPALAADTDVHIEGLDYADLKPFDDAYLGEVRDHLSFWPRLIGARWRRRENDVVDLGRERSVGLVRWVLRSRGQSVHVVTFRLHCRVVLLSSARQRRDERPG